MASHVQSVKSPLVSLHAIGVISAITAGAWLGSAEAPTKLVSADFSPILISLCMVTGVFVARWTLPTIMKGTGFVFKDIADKPHLTVWAVLAGALWAVANTLTVVAIRNVGLSIAFPLWNTNSLVGLFWGWFLFRELRGAGLKTWSKVVGGAIIIVGATVMLALATIHPGASSSARALPGVLAALVASLMWGTMYIPYRKAYLSGMNPLSFVTIFTVGELGTMIVLALTMSGNLLSLSQQLHHLRPSLFWLFLGGFCWVVGDMFQHFATKYIGICRGIPLSNTNQLWGLAWGVLVFGELAGATRATQLTVILGSAVMIAGALAIGSAAAHGDETESRDLAIERECQRYGLDYRDAVAAQSGISGSPQASDDRSNWDYLIVATAIGIFIWLGVDTKRPSLPFQTDWIVALSLALLFVLAGSGWLLWKKTRFA